MIHCTLCVKRMHDLRWVHRDLKPGNVLRLPKTHTWTLIDFGSTARIGATFPVWPLDKRHLPAR
jgi:serine/threonine protein kinase